MLNIAHTLERLGYNATCYTQAVQQVRENLGGHPIPNGIMFIKELIGADTQFASNDEALLTCQAIVEDAIKNEGKCIGNDAEETLELALKRARAFINNPAHKWMFAKPEGTSVTITEERIIDGVETTVAVNKEGKLKKGEKQRLAEERYQNWLKTAENPNDNQAFIKILMDEFEMTKAGATTYNYNMKKKFNPTNVTAKPKRAK